MISCKNSWDFIYFLVDIILKQDFLVLNDTEMTFFGVKRCLNKIFLPQWYSKKIFKVLLHIESFHSGDIIHFWRELRKSCQNTTRFQQSKKSSIEQCGETENLNLTHAWWRLLKNLIISQTIVIMKYLLKFLLRLGYWNYIYWADWLAWLYGGNKVAFLLY